MISSLTYLHGSCTMLNDRRDEGDSAITEVPERVWQKQVR